MGRTAISSRCVPLILVSVPQASFPSPSELVPYIALNRTIKFSICPDYSTRI